MEKEGICWESSMLEALLLINYLIPKYLSLILIKLMLPGNMCTNLEIYLMSEPGSPGPGSPISPFYESTCFLRRTTYQHDNPHPDSFIPRPDSIHIIVPSYLYPEGYALGSRSSIL